MEGSLGGGLVDHNATYSADGSTNAFSVTLGLRALRDFEDDIDTG